MNDITIDPLRTVPGSAHRAGLRRNLSRFRWTRPSTPDHCVPVWSFFGHDEPNYTYMKDGRKLLSELAALSSVPVYVRVHSLLVTGDGQAALKWGSTNAYTEDASGKPVYDWTITDRIFDTYMERKMKPLVQIGFMPEALSVSSRALPPSLEAGRQLQRHLYRLGLSAEGLRQVGGTGVPVGDPLRPEIRDAPRWRPGCGRSGTNQTSATGKGRRRNTTSSTTTPWTRCGARCPPRVVGGPDSTGPAAAARRPSCATSWSTWCTARTTSPARPVRRWTS